MRRFVRTLMAALVAAPAAAATALTAEEFDRYTRGRTLTYALEGRVYGAEEYLPGRRVRWAFAGEDCRDGRWYPQDGDICFVYEHDPVPQCWQFFVAPGGLIARFSGDAETLPLTEVQQAPEGLLCPGPDVGV
ncbi:MAG: hypothetical protein IE927_10370 [Rhodobacterales bacterium]|nr:hypothetical protein [Rhodobacterales bacterium]